MEGSSESEGRDFIDVIIFSLYRKSAYFGLAFGFNHIVWKQRVRELLEGPTSLFMVIR